MHCPFALTAYQAQSRLWAMGLYPVQCSKLSFRSHPKTTQSRQDGMTFRQTQPQGKPRGEEHFPLSFWPRDQDRGTTWLVSWSCLLSTERRPPTRRTTLALERAAWKLASTTPTWTRGAFWTTKRHSLLPTSRLWFQSFNVAPKNCSTVGAKPADKQATISSANSMSPNRVFKLTATPLSRRTRSR